MCGEVFQEGGTARAKALSQGNSKEDTHSGWRAVSEEEAGNEVRDVRRDSLCGAWSGLPLLLGAEGRQGKAPSRGGIRFKSHLNRRTFLFVPSSHGFISPKSVWPSSLRKPFPITTHPRPTRSSAHFLTWPIFGVSPLYPHGNAEDNREQDSVAASGTCSSGQYNDLQ